MIEVREYSEGGLPKTDITLTRGDSANLVLPIFQINSDGTKTAYTVTGSDTVEVMVRATPVTKSGTTPAVVINGTVTISDGKPNWSISHSNSTIDAGVYFWDAQITTSGKVYTFYSGQFIVVPEVTM